MSCWAWEGKHEKKTFDGYRTVKVKVKKKKKPMSETKSILFNGSLFEYLSTKTCKSYLEWDPIDEVTRSKINSLIIAVTKKISTWYSRGALK
jgi:hypothetical protein